MQTPAALSITNLRKTYPNGVEALKGVDLNVAAGDFFALLGPNGAGKSTLISAVTSLVNITDGNIEIFGDDLKRTPEKAKALIGIVPQEFNMGIFRQLEHSLITQAGYYGIDRKTAKIRAEHYLKKLDLWPKRHNIIRSLSGGMKRRFMIARALIHQPKLLILDEPTAGVDIEIRRSMWHFLEELNAEGTTIILTTHYLEEAENLCRNIAIIDQGNIVENTNMSALLKQLRAETLILYLKDPINFTPDLKQFALKTKDPSTLEATLTAGQSVNDLIMALSRLKIEVDRIKNKAGRLEELFVNLVGT